MSVVGDRGRQASQPRLLLVLRQPVQLHPHLPALHRRHRAGALARRPATPSRRAPAHPSQPHVRADARVGHGVPARPPGGGDHRRPLRRAAGGVHHVPRLRRGGPPLRHRAGRCSGHAAQARSSHRPHRGGRAPRIAPVQVRGALGSWPVPGHHLPRPLRHLARGPGDQLVRGGRRAGGHRRERRGHRPCEGLGRQGGPGRPPLRRRGAARSVRHGIGLPRADHVPPRARAGHARVDRRPSIRG